MEENDIKSIKTNDTDNNEELKKFLKKREYVYKEIITTEITYVDRLRGARDVIIQPLFWNNINILDSNDLRTQFDDLYRIYELHNKHPFDIAIDENILEQSIQCINLFDDITNNFQIYTDYLVNYEPAMQRRGHLLIYNRKFYEFIEKSEKDIRLQGQSLESIFILPVQRIPRYRLLLEQLLKYTPIDHNEYNIVKNALDKICDMAMFSNEAIRARENKAKIMEIMLSINPLSRVDLLEDPDRRFIKEGLLKRQCRRGLKDYQFWLFTDQLLYGQASPLGLYKLHRQIPLSKCFVSSVESSVEEGYSFMVESPAKSFIVHTKDKIEHKEWLDSIDKAIHDIAKKGSKGRRASFAPLWVPDSHSAECTICNLGFSLLSRRHHCRHCGVIVCDKCSKKRIFIEHVDGNQEVRVCDKCFEYLSPDPEVKDSRKIESSEELCVNIVSPIALHKQKNKSIFSTITNDDNNNITNNDNTNNINQSLASITTNIVDEDDSDDEGITNKHISLDDVIKEHIRRQSLTTPQEDDLDDEQEEDTDTVGPLALNPSQATATTNVSIFTKLRNGNIFERSITSEGSINNNKRTSIFSSLFSSSNNNNNNNASSVLNRNCSPTTTE